WRLADLGAKHAMLLAGMGWGNMPLHMVASDMEVGRLVELKMKRWPRHVRRATIATVLVHRLDNPPGPAGTWLLGRLAGGPEVGSESRDSPRYQPFKACRSSRTPRRSRRPCGRA